MLEEKKIPKEGNRRTWSEIKDICNKFELSFENIGDFLLEEGNVHIPEYLDFIVYEGSRTLFATEHKEIGYKTLQPFYSYPVNFIFTPNNPDSLVVLTSPGIWTIFGKENIKELIQRKVIERLELNCEQYKKYVMGFTQSVYEDEFVDSE